MKIKPKFYAVKMHGKVVPNDPAEIEKYISQWKEGQEIEIMVSKKYKRRTSGQTGEETNFNGYWWAVVVKMIADHMGELDQDYVHHQVLIQIGHFRIDKFGEKHPEETKEMSGAEFADICSRARIWASQKFNLYIPEPHEAGYGPDKDGG